MAVFSDTHPAARDRMIAYCRSLGPEHRAEKLAALNRGAMALAAARQEAWYPDDTPEERRLRLASLWVPRLGSPAAGEHRAVLRRHQHPGRGRS